MALTTLGYERVCLGAMTWSCSDENAKKFIVNKIVSVVLSLSRKRVRMCPLD